MCCDEKSLHGYTDPSSGEVVRPYTITLFCRKDMIVEGSNDDLLSNWCSSYEQACNAFTSKTSISKASIIRQDDLSRCSLGHVITMIEKY